MKTNKFLIAATAVAMLFASCAKEKANDVSGTGAGLTSPTYATFTFKNSVTRAGTVSDADAGAAEADAKVIKDVRLLIFNATTQALEVNDLIATISGGKISKLVTPGQKKMYVIANVESNIAMNAALNDLDVGIATLTDFLALTYTATGTPGQRPSVVYPTYEESTDFTIMPLATKTPTVGFPMSSTDAMAYTFAPNIAETVATGGTATATATNATNSFAVSLEFMLAKVGVAKSATYSEIGGALDSPVYAVRNIAKKTFITQQFASPSVVKSYYHTMFNASTSQSVFNTDFDYSAIATTPVAANLAGLTDGTGKYIYAAENTNQSIRVGQATYVAIKGNFRPSNTKVAANMTWVATAAVGSKLSLGEGTQTAANTTFVVLKKALASGSTPVGTYFADEASVQKAIALDASAGANTNYTGTPADDYTVYTNGVSWYRINVGDNAFTPTKYGVERGKVYEITINKVTGPGVNHEDGLIVGPNVDPGTPLSEQTYISASISAKGWSTVSQTSDL